MASPTPCWQAVVLQTATMRVHYLWLLSLLACSPSGSNGNPPAASAPTASVTERAASPGPQAKSETLATRLCAALHALPRQRRADCCGQKRLSRCSPNVSKGSVYWSRPSGWRCRPRTSTDAWRTWSARWRGAIGSVRTGCPPQAGVSASCRDDCDWASRVARVSPVVTIYTVPGSLRRGRACVPSRCRSEKNARSAEIPWRWCWARTTPDRRTPRVKTDTVGSARAWPTANSVDRAAPKKAAAPSPVRAGPLRSGAPRTKRRALHRWKLRRRASLHRSDLSKTQSPRRSVPAKLGMLRRLYRRPVPEDLRPGSGLSTFESPVTGSMGVGAATAVGAVSPRCIKDRRRQ